MITQNLLLLTCSSLLILVHLLQTSHANPYCSPSACGIIPNISFPFRLKDDPKHCGDPSYELACENNVTSIYLNSQKYHVKAINYHNFTIRLVDVSIKNKSCSFPKYSVDEHNFSDGYPYSTRSYKGFYAGDELEVAWPINFMSCQYPLKNSSLLTETTDCANGDNFFNASNSSSGRHTYIKVGHMNASDVKDMCRVDLIVMTSWKFEDFNDIVSVSEIHDSLLYGFELSWFRFGCSKCKETSDCYVIEGNKATCFQPSSWWGVLEWLIPILPLTAVVLLAGVCPAANIIFGLIASAIWGPLIFVNLELSFGTPSSTLLNLLVIIGALLIYAAVNISS